MTLMILSFQAGLAGKIIDKNNQGHSQNRLETPASKMGRKTSPSSSLLSNQAQK